MCLKEQSKLFNSEKEKEVTTGKCTWDLIIDLSEGNATYCPHAKRSDKNSLNNCLTEACGVDRNAVNMQ